MLHITTIAILILSASLSGCNKARITMSSQDEPSKQNKSIDASSPPEEITTTDSSIPKQWPRCWLSDRLAVKTAFDVAGSRGSTRGSPTYVKSDGRQEFKSTSYNPTTSGNCILNWFDQNHSQEPWVALFKQKFTRYRGLITCSASPTPDCMCAQTYPELFDGFLNTEGLCIRKTAANSYELYDVRQPDPSKTVEAKGACDAVRSTVESISKTNVKRANFLQQNQDKPEVGRHDQTCRTDFEPFAPLPEEKDWYASKIRDWAVTTCTDNNTNCRCYAFYNKSGHQEGVRSSVIENDTCLLCENSTCQVVDTIGTL